VPWTYTRSPSLARMLCKIRGITCWRVRAYTRSPSLARMLCKIRGTTCWRVRVTRGCTRKRA